MMAETVAAVPAHKPVKRVQVIVLGERDFPLAQFYLEEIHVKDFAALVDAIHTEHPALTDKEVIRLLWRYGTRSIRGALSKRVPLRIDEE
jgi:hypothetical protein